MWIVTAETALYLVSVASWRPNAATPHHQETKKTTSAYSLHLMGGWDAGCGEWTIGQAFLLFRCSFFASIFTAP
jgi:hypothetical protein